MKSVELFAGAGGLALGACRAGFAPQAVIEWNDHCNSTLEENRRRGVPFVSQWPLHHLDVRRFDFSRLSNVDLVAGGPPCQPFSIGGRHKAYDDHRDMWPEAVRAVRETRSRAFVFENVFGLARPAFSDYLEYIILQLSHPDVARRGDESWSEHRARLERHHTKGSRDGLHYRVLFRVLDAANYGVPQRRRRLFVVGFREDLGIEYDFPAATHSQAALRAEQMSAAYWDRHHVRAKDRVISHQAPLPFGEEAALRPWRTVRDAIADLPDPRVAGHGIANHRFQPGAKQYVGHTGSPLDAPAKALKAGDHGVPGGENMLLMPDGSVRYFTVREAARLQTFPDDMQFEGAWSEQMRQLGNAVPVDLSHVIMSSIRTRLSEADSTQKTKATVGVPSRGKTTNASRGADRPQGGIRRLQSTRQDASVGKRGRSIVVPPGRPVR